MNEAMPKENTKTLFFKIYEYFKKHPAIAGSFFYIFFSAIGVTYSWTLYRNFQINIFDYAEANDFLLMAFKNLYIFLVSLIALIGGVVFSAIYIFVKLSIKERSFGKAKTIWFDSMRYGDGASTIIGVFISVVFLIMIYIPYSRANTSAMVIKHEAPAINVLYLEGKQASTSVVKELKSSLIGTTEKFMFFYNHSDKNTIVIPITKIVRITIDKKQ